jgi:polyhydroxyalkanoate synthesis repressor PhaR
MAKPKVTIRKYGNRRLYDTGGSRYVNLEEIARMVRDGIEVEVRDARSGEDLTRVILTQIIVEEARDRKTGLPLQLLRELVMASDRATHDFLSWYLNTARELHGKAQDTLQARLTEARQAVSNPLEFVRNLLPGYPPPTAGDESEMEELRARIRELETRLAGRKTRKRPSSARQAAPKP